MIWTTTPWTLPANLAIAVNPELDYAWSLTVGDEYLLVAEALMESFLKTVGKEPPLPAKPALVRGAALEGWRPATLSSPGFPRSCWRTMSPRSREPDVST